MAKVRMCDLCESVFKPDWEKIKQRNLCISKKSTVSEKYELLDLCDSCYKKLCNTLNLDIDCGYN